MAELKGFMGKMREGDMRGIVANLQAALNFSQECLRVYAEKLEEATGKKLPELTDDEKRKIARKAHMLNGNALKMIYCPWSPGTILGWYSTLIAQKYNSTGPNQKRRGRPVIPQETVDIIVRIGSNNPNWGYQRIHHYLLHLGMYAPSEPHGEEEEGFFRVGIYQKDECRRAMMTARRHFPLHNNEPELIDYFVSPLGSANQSVPPEWNSNEAERLRAIRESRCRSLCMSRRTNTG